MKWTLAELAELTQSELIGDPNHVITSVSDLQSACKEDATFLAPMLHGQPRYEKAMQQSNAGVVFIAERSLAIEGRNFLLANDPSRCFQMVFEKFVADKKAATGFEGIHPTAVIHPTAAR